MNAILIGCTTDLQAQLRRLLASQDIPIDGEFPSVSVAIDRLRGADHETRLFLFYADAIPELPELKRLRGAFVGNPILTILSDQIDSGQILSALRMGATQVVQRPLQHEDFRAALDCIGLQFGFSGKKGTLIAVQSVTGGCGATTLAINLAHEIAHRRQSSVILTELSLRMGMLAALMDREPHRTTYDLFGNMDRLDLHLVESALLPIDERVRLLAGPYQLAAPLLVTAQDVLRLGEYLRRLADVVIVDLPSSFDDVYFEVLAGADHFIMVAEQRLSSMRAVQLYHEAVQRDPLFQRGTLTAHFLLNRYNPKLEGFGVAKLRELLRLPELLTLADDAPTVTAATNNGSSIRATNARSRIVEDLGVVVNRLFAASAQPVPIPKANHSGLSRLVRAFGLA